MKISLVTINYNNATATKRLLASLQTQTDKDFDVVVVDNASRAEDRKELSEGWPDTIILWNDRNLGFSGGNNVGIRHALERDAEWVVCINNDTHVEPDFIANLRRDLPMSMGIIAIPLREGDRTAYAGRVAWLKPTFKHIYSREELDGKIYAIGAGVAIHRSVFDLIGFWDERYFLYFEDADFSMRAREAGIPLSVAEHARITHDGSTTTGKLGRPLLLRYHARNALLFNSLHGPGKVKIALPFVSFFGMLMQVAKIIFAPSKRAESRAILHGIVDFWQDNFGKIT